MTIIDIIILIFLAFGFLIGFKRGFTKQLVSTLGLLLVLIISYLFKNPISSLFYDICPFIKFGGSFEGLTALNIILYEFLAFLIIGSVLLVIFRILLKFTKIFESILNFTIILGIPSKILGGIVGVFENFVYVFILLFFMSIPMFQVPVVNNSYLAPKILESTPILSGVCNKSITLFNDIVVLKKSYNKEDNKKLNSKIVNMLVDYNYITKDNVNKLIEKGKLDNIDYEG